MKVFELMNELQHAPAGADIRIHSQCSDTHGDANYVNVDGDTADATVDLHFIEDVNERVSDEKAEKAA